MSGSNTESDQSLLERFYAKVRSQGTSGNKAQYRQWANEIAGVGGVKWHRYGTDPVLLGCIFWIRTSVRQARILWMRFSSILTLPRMDRVKGLPRRVRLSP